MKKSLVICCGLVWRAGKLLVSQRKVDTHLGGLWEFPGGKQHRGESDVETVRRELKEETDLDVIVENLFEEIHFSYPERDLVLRFYTCRVAADGEARPLQVAQIRWVEPGTLKSLPFPPANESLIGKLSAELHKHG